MNRSRKLFLDDTSRFQSALLINWENSTDEAELNIDSLMAEAEKIFSNPDAYLPSEEMVEAVA